MHSGWMLHMFFSGIMSLRLHDRCSHIEDIGNKNMGSAAVNDSEEDKAVLIVHFISFFGLYLDFFQLIIFIFTYMSIHCANYPLYPHTPTFRQNLFHHLLL
jgi:uncharacterized membrane protein